MGSEMCIRDSVCPGHRAVGGGYQKVPVRRLSGLGRRGAGHARRPRRAETLDSRGGRPRFGGSCQGVLGFGCCGAAVGGAGARAPRAVDAARAADVLTWGVLCVHAASMSSVDSVGVEPRRSVGLRAQAEAAPPRARMRRQRAIAVWNRSLTLSNAGPRADHSNPHLNLRGLASL